MSKPLGSITQKVMGRIHSENIKMRPRVFFILGSCASFVGLVMSILASVFLFSFITLSLQSDGMMVGYEIDELLSHFSWWGPLGALTSLLVGIWFLRLYEFSYKRNFVLIAVGFVLAVLAASFILNSTGLNKVMFQLSVLQDTSGSEFPAEFALYKEQKHMYRQFHE
jgi:hypothetical protein